MRQKSLTHAGGCWANRQARRSRGESGTHATNGPNEMTTITNGHGSWSIPALMLATVSTCAGCSPEPDCREIRTCVDSLDAGVDAGSRADSSATIDGSVPNARTSDSYDARSTGLPAPDHQEVEAALAPVERRSDRDASALTADRGPTGSCAGDCVCLSGVCAPALAEAGEAGEAGDHDASRAASRDARVDGAWDASDPQDGLQGLIDASEANVPETLDAMKPAEAGPVVLRVPDGEGCTIDDECATGHCSLYFRDADGDGYPTTTTLRGWCGVRTASKNSEYISIRADGKWDCCDAESFIHPDAEASDWSWDGVASKCDIPIGDANCDGTVEMQSTKTTDCVASGDTCTAVTTPLACGQRGAGCVCGRQQDGTCKLTCYSSSPGFCR